MGAIISAPLAAVAGCGGTCIGMCCGKLASSGTIEDKKASRRLYFCLQIFALLLIWLLRAVGRDWFHWLPSGITSCEHASLVEDHGQSLSPVKKALQKLPKIFKRKPTTPIDVVEEVSDVIMDCWAEQMTTRVAFSMAFISILLCVLSAVGAQNKALLHFWFLKFAALPVLVFTMLFIPNGFFDGIISTAQFTSILFLIAQMALLLDLGHNWNELWISNALADQRQFSSGKRWKAGIILAALSFVAFGVTITSVVHSAFTSPFQHSIIWVNFSFGLLFIILSSIEIVPHAAFLPTCLVFAYMTLISWQACLSFVAGDDSSEAERNRQKIAATVFAFLFLGASLASYVRDLKIFDKDEPLLAADDDEETGGGGDTSVSVSMKSTAIFFLVHSLASLYMITILIKTPSGAAFWAQSVADWLMIVLFGWSLIAPLVCGGRDFGY